jgi:hypothetical protein
MKPSGVRTWSRAPDPLPLPSQIFQLNIPTSCVVVAPLDHLNAAVSAKCMLAVVSAYKYLGMVEFEQVIEARFVAPARGVSV